MKFDLHLPFHDDPIPVVLDFTPPIGADEQEFELATLHNYDLEMNGWRGNHHTEGYHALRDSAKAAYDGLVAAGVLSPEDGSDAYEEDYDIEDDVDEEASIFEALVSERERQWLAYSCSSVCAAVSAGWWFVSSRCRRMPGMARISSKEAQR